MWSKILLRVCIGLAGVAALYSAYFLYEDEAGRFQNRIEEFWVSIDERRRKGESLALPNKVASLTNNMLNRILGTRLFSFRMVAITVCYSLAGLQFWELMLMASGISQVTLNGYQLEQSPLMYWMILKWDVAVFLTLVAAGTIASRYPNKWTTGLALVIIPGTLYLNVVPLFFSSNVAPSILFLLSVVSDVLFVAAVRWTLRWLKGQPNVRSFLFGVALQLGIILLLVFLPWHMGHTGASGSITQETDNSISLGFRISREFELFGLNTCTGIFSISFLAVLVFMLLHKLIWPFASRLLYPIARFQIIRNRKIMAAIGIACVAVISPPFADLLKKLSQMFH